jgi:hypothetical protein
VKSLISVLLNLTGQVLPGEALAAPLLMAVTFAAFLVSGLAGRIALWCAARLSRPLRSIRESN